MLLARHACRVLVPLRSCPRKPASTMTPRVWRARPFSRQSFIFNCQTAARAGLQRHASSPVFFVEAPGRPVSRLVFSPLGKARGMARQVTQPFILCVPVFPLENTGAPLGAPPGQARAVRAYLRAFSLRHRAVLFVGRETDHPSAKLLAGSSCWPPDGVPVPPGCVLARHARGRRIPVPPSDASR